MTFVLVLFLSGAPALAGEYGSALDCVEAAAEFPILSDWACMTLAEWGRMGR